MLKVEGVGIRFGGLIALNNVTFEIRKGEVLGIIGPNGAGKTTLFNVISGLYKPDEGVIIFEGKNITTMPPHKIVRLGISRTFQTVSLYFNLPAIGNLLITLTAWYRSGVLSALREENGDETFKEAMELLNFVGLDEKAFTPVKNLPQEAQRRLSIAIALATKPKLLLLDEPTAGLNLEETDRILEIIRTLKERGVTVAIIEHKMRFIMGVSDRIVVLDSGEIIAEGSPKEIVENERVIKAYLGESYVV
ncbi:MULTISPECIES: ABC transporter ATP-binding protein [Archaeoglobus]|jgi:ABC-type branched-subunit amino acid transport system ATPase component|uniref:Probable branched-chain amino acid transport ATP-binding protein LivG n=3 Tax=Archaeoglobus fulgidus TaxID=2234 RepID=O29435_ARCFU|nr:MULTISPECIES: ABC transporter ATP-binding protein [Archaeoglobus]AAB90412.1 branched-chain amino acid ABC transporter, ATP-binding protein (braG-2) [Archaeoglobus fulgidus DSM 4304]AIG97701.1 ABC-type branched-chain amino acid transport system, ATPase component [Archaeoglobus fulgidus DSM 8774]KUJ92989.1 MAG: Branched-chain amino acid ABC transporter, ATP-binding protein (BraG-2) [Archaeoglobus fulgidus]KUK06512.1 MAG: Branched-chain amino acid ABC transporter, ATP-binding protein (BraG-2) [